VVRTQVRPVGGTPVASRLLYVTSRMLLQALATGYVVISDVPSYHNIAGLPHAVRRRQHTACGIAIIGHHCHELVSGNVSGPGGRPLVIAGHSRDQYAPLPLMVCP